MNSSEFRELMRTNVGRARGKKLLIVSSCIVDDKLDVLSPFSNDEFFKLKVCMEAEEFNRVAYKILSFIVYSNISEVYVVTVEGSPHCLQLHHILDDIRRHFAEVNVKHYVVNKGELIEIPERAVKISRYLTKIKKMLET